VLFDSFEVMYSSLEIVSTLILGSMSRNKRSHLDGPEIGKPSIKGRFIAFHVFSLTKDVFSLQKYGASWSCSTRSFVPARLLV
jgi:hypothetical protein